MELKVFTVVTHSDGYFKSLQESCKKNKINLDILGWGETYSGHMFKTDKTIEYLRNQDPNQIVLFVDGFDSLIVDDQSTILSKFLQTRESVLFSEDFECTNRFKATIMESVYYFILKNRKKVNGQRINSGMFIGYSKDLLDIFNRSLEYKNDSNQHSNQRVLQDMCEIENNITTDKEKLIMYNLDIFDRDFQIDNNNKLVINKNIYPSVISAPGNVSLDSICKLYGYQGKSDRSFFKYVKQNFFVANYKMIIFLVVLFFFLIIKIYI